MVPRPNANATATLTQVGMYLVMPSRVFLVAAEVLGRLAGDEVLLHELADAFVDQVDVITQAFAVGIRDAVEIGLLGQGTGNVLGLGDDGRVGGFGRLRALRRDEFGQLGGGVILGERGSARTLAGRW